MLNDITTVANFAHPAYPPVHDTVDTLNTGVIWHLNLSITRFKCESARALKLTE